MDLELLPREIRLNIISRLPTGALRQLMLVNHSLGDLAREQFDRNSVVVLRGVRRLHNFYNNITNNPGSRFRTFRHITFENYNAIEQGNIIVQILREMLGLQTLSLSRSNVSRALPLEDLEETFRYNFPMAGLLRITVDPMPRLIPEQTDILHISLLYRASLEYLRMPPIHAEVYRLNPLMRNLPRFLRALVNLRSLLLEFSVPLALDSILVSALRLEFLELAYIPRAGQFDFTVQGPHRILLPDRNNTLRQLNITMNLLSPALMRFIQQHFERLDHLVLIGEIRNRRAASNILSHAPPVPNITNLEIQNQSSIHQLLPGIMDAFLHVNHLTISRRGLHIDAPNLSLAFLVLTMLNIDRLAIPSARVALIVETTVSRRRRNFVREGENNLRFVEVNRLPIAIFTIRIFVNGLQHLRLFDSTNRNYQQFFYIDQ